MHDKFNVIFEGKLKPGRDKDQVVKCLKQLMKIDDKGIERLFGGKPYKVRKNTDRVIAEKIKNAFASAGALCEIRKVITQEELGHEFAEEQIADSSSHRKSIKNHYTTAPDGGKMIITNIETVPGKTVVEHFGLVSGSTIRAKHIGRDFMASLKNLVGGELKGYTQLLQESRRQAMDRMMEEARMVGANAIVNVRFSTSSVAQGAAELYAYGTAVRVE